MNNLFYLFGILYFITSVYNFFSYDHKRDVGVDIDTNLSDLVEETEKKQERNSQMYYPRQMVAFLFFIWTCIGYLADFPEKTLFLYNLVLLALNFFILISIGFMLAVKAHNILENNWSFPHKEKSEKIEIPLTKIVYFLEIIIVGSILVIHYFLL
jgi:hypothetical protein